MRLGLTRETLLEARTNRPSSFVAAETVLNFGLLDSMQGCRGRRYALQQHDIRAWTASNAGSSRPMKEVKVKVRYITLIGINARCA